MKTCCRFHFKGPSFLGDRVEGSPVKGGDTGMSRRPEHGGRNPVSFKDFFDHGRLRLGPPFAVALFLLWEGALLATAFIYYSINRQGREQGSLLHDIRY